LRVSSLHSSVYKPASDTKDSEDYSDRLLDGVNWEGEISGDYKHYQPEKGEKPGKGIMEITLYI
jgi:hypothetical protein